MIANCILRWHMSVIINIKFATINPTINVHKLPQHGYLDNKGWCFLDVWLCLLYDIFYARHVFFSKQSSKPITILTCEFPTYKLSTAIISCIEMNNIIYIYSTLNMKIYLDLSLNAVNVWFKMKMVVNLLIPCNVQVNKYYFEEENLC